MSAAEVAFFDFFHSLRMFIVVEVFQGAGLAVIVNLFDSQTLDRLRFMRVAGEFTVTDDTSGKRERTKKNMSRKCTIWTLRSTENKFYLFKLISHTLHRIKDTSPTIDMQSRLFLTLTSTP